MPQIKKYITYILCGAAALIPPAVFFYLLEFYTHNPFAQVRPWAQFFNILLFELIAGILFCLTGRLRCALRIEGTAAMLFGIANAYVTRFRTNPIVPWDIFSWQTAANVAGNYDFSVDLSMAVVTILFIAAIVFLQPVKFRLGRSLFWRRCIPGTALTLALVLFAGLLQREDFQNRHMLYNKLFTPVFMTEVDGIAVTFVMNLAYMSIDKPAKYSADESREILLGYEMAASPALDAPDMPLPQGELPNIIVVMNESFSDLSALGDFSTSRDYMPYLHSLQQGAENTITGMLNVSVCGGNTANTEFEFLTGNTMAFLPQGSIPYQQYLAGDYPSLAAYLRELGYQTAATHPYYASGWERDTVYPWLGFSQSLFLDSYDEAERLRAYVSDAACVEKIIDLYENKEEGKPLFVFNVTMQNHGGYQDLYNNFMPEITVPEAGNFSLDQYLSLVELSDRSLASLIQYFSGVDEKTVVVFFGDHQPGDEVAASILAMHGMAWNALDQEELKLRYQVPYAVWANYDIKEAKNADTSANYLAAEVLARAGVPLNAYQKFLLELKESYPVISTVRTVRGDGEETAASEEAQEMDTYRRLQYYQLFDREGKR